MSRHVSLGPLVAVTYLLSTLLRFPKHGYFEYNANKGMACKSSCHLAPLSFILLKLPVVSCLLSCVMVRPRPAVLL